MDRVTTIIDSLGHLSGTAFCARSPIACGLARVPATRLSRYFAHRITHGAAARRWWAPGSRRSALAALRRWIAAALAVLVGVAVLVAPLATAQAAVAGSRVDLRVLVLSDGGAATTAIATQLDREGVPYTWVNLIGTSRPVIDAAFLENAAAHEGKYQAVVLPNQAGTSTPGA